jgi:hypothetical protein
MTRRAFHRILLSLLLLLAQQVGVMHVTAHWSERVVAAAAEKPSKEDGVSKSIAQDQGCDQCFAFAQLASAVGQEPRSFVPPSQDAQAIAGASAHAIFARAPCAFRSRAPPAVV